MRVRSTLQVKSPKAFNSRIYTLIKDAMDLKGDLTVSPQDESIEVGPDHSLQATRLSLAACL